MTRIEPHAANNDADPAQLERAQEMWHNFKRLATWSTAHILVILVLLAWFFL